MSKILKSALIVIGSIVCTTIAINASDMVRGISDSGQESTFCPVGMTVFNHEGEDMCIDMYEVSVSSECTHSIPGSAIQTEDNINNRECFGVSEEGKEPWRYVSLTQAQRICAESGKRLPTNSEWYAAALATDINSCVLDQSRYKSTGNTSCISGVGAYDMIGNVWEWVDGEVVDGVYDNKTVPGEGYVQSVDADGGMMRGGFYGSGEDGGIFAINAAVPHSFVGSGVGFRCVK
jgi:formylglycine-generating enzyme required for sulfatase activity